MDLRGSLLTAPFLSGRKLRSFRNSPGGAQSRAASKAFGTLIHHFKFLPTHPIPSISKGLLRREAPKVLRMIREPPAVVRRIR